MKKLTRIQAWKRIKKAFQIYDHSAPALTRDPNSDYMLTNTGLCYAVERLYDFDRISIAVRRKMDEDIRANKPEDAGSLWWWGTDAEGARKRVEVINKILKS